MIEFKQNNIKKNSFAVYNNQLRCLSRHKVRLYNDIWIANVYKYIYTSMCTLFLFKKSKLDLK